MARVKIPDDFLSQSLLAKKIIDKHKLDGDKSLLKEILDMKDFEQIVEKSIEHDDKKTELKRLAELETEKRNNTWQNGEGTIRYIAQYLKAYFRDNPHALGSWGFTVDSSPRRKKKPQTKPDENIQNPES